MPGTTHASSAPPARSQQATTLLVGVDPGATGALAFLQPDEPRLTGVADMPPNPHDTAEMLRYYLNLGYSLKAIIEVQQAYPKQGVTSSFTGGFNYGVLIGILAALQIPYTEVRASEWKRKLGLIGKDKDASRALARTKWPEEDCFKRVKDHGRAEAALLAWWGTRYA